MVIHDIEGYCDLVENTMEEWEELDSINNFILDYVSEDSVQIADSTLNLFLENLGLCNVWAYNITTQNIFNSNIEIWQDISDKNFIENTGKCFSLMSVIDETHEEHNSYLRQAYDSYLINVESVLTDDISLRQEVQRTIQEQVKAIATRAIQSTACFFTKTVAGANRRSFNKSQKDFRFLCILCLVFREAVFI